MVDAASVILCQGAYFPCNMQAFTKNTEWYPTLQFTIFYVNLTIYHSLL